MKKEDNWTALHLAARYGHLEIVKLLLDHGAKIDEKTKIGSTALVLAVRDGTDDMVKLLLDHGAKIDAKDKNNWTALHFAVYHGLSIDNVKLLLDHGAKIDAKDKDNWTALHFAAYHGSSIDKVKLLLDHGAKIDAKDKDNWTALHLAACYNHLEIVQLLLDHGAKTDVKQKDNWTALHFAAYYNHVDVLKIFLNTKDMNNNPKKFLESLAELSLKEPDIIKLLISISEIYKIQLEARTQEFKPRWKFSLWKGYAKSEKLNAVNDFLLALKSKNHTVSPNHLDALCHNGFLGKISNQLPPNEKKRIGLN